MAVLIALALMTGLQGELRERIVGSSAHVYVFKLGEGHPRHPGGSREAAADPARRRRRAGGDRQGAADRRASISRRPVTIKGIDPALEPTVTDIRKSMREGSLEAIRIGPEEMDGIVLGIDLAETLDVQARRHRPAAHARPGPDAVRADAAHARASRSSASSASGCSSSTASTRWSICRSPSACSARTSRDFMQLRLDDMFASQAVAEDIPRRLGEDYATQDWAQMNKSLFSALWLEKMAISITIGLIIMVAALNIVASLVLLVMEKSRDIAILKTMGSSAASIRRIFMLQGLIIGADRHRRRHRRRHARSSTCSIATS